MHHALDPHAALVLAVHLRKLTPTRPQKDNHMQLLWRLLGTPPWAATITTNQETIMASQFENQKKIDALTESLDASTATQEKAKGEILAAIEDLRAQAAAAEQELDFTKVEEAAGKLGAGADDLDALNEDEPEPAPEVPADPAPETPADPLVDGASVGQPEQTA